MLKEVDTRYTQDRELSWLKFNERVLSEARDESVPLMERLREGFAMVANPMNPRQVRRVDLRPEAVDGIVFWSKNPAPLLAYEKALRPYRCAWQFTLNAYAADVEPGVPSEAARLETLI